MGTAGRGRGDPEHGEGEERRGAVGVLVRRVLADKMGREVSDWEIERDVLPRVHARSEAVSGYFAARQEWTGGARQKWSGRGAAIVARSASAGLEHARRSAPT